MIRSIPLDRRRFLQLGGLTAAALTTVSTNRQVGIAAPPDHRDAALANEIGIVSASAHSQLTGRAKGRKFTLLELPRILSDELDLRVV